MTTSWNLVFKREAQEQNLLIREWWCLVFFKLWFVLTAAAALDGKPPTAPVYSIL
jgi:hypothetical protein